MTEKFYAEARLSPRRDAEVLSVGKLPAENKATAQEKEKPRVLESKAVRLFGFALPLALLVIMLAVSVLGLGQALMFNPMGLVPTLHAIFLTGIGIVVATVSARSYLRYGDFSVLLLGAAVFAFAVVALIGGILGFAATGLPGGALLSNYSTIINNVTTFASSALQAVSAVAAFAVLIPGKSQGRKAALASAYLGVVAFIMILSAATFAGAMPAFMTSQGPTLTRTIVLGVTVFLFASSCVLFMRLYQKSDVKTLLWYSLALGLFAIAFLSFMLQLKLADTFGWIGRVAEYSGGIFFLVALLQRPAVAGAGSPLSQRWSEAFRRSRGQVDLLFANMNDALAYCKVMFDRDGKPVDYVFLDTNAAFTRLTGIGKEIISKKSTEVEAHLWEDPSRRVEVFGKVASTGLPARFEVYSQQLQKWFAVSAYCPEKGYFVEQFEDITERKKAEEALKSSEERFSKFFYSNQQAVAISESDGKIIDVNNSFELLFDINRKDLIGHFMSDFVKYGDFAKRQRTIDLLNQGKTVEDNQTYITPTGKEIATIYFTQVITLNGKKQLFGMWQDITERKKVEEALKESEQYYRSLFSSMTEMFQVLELIYDENGKPVDYYYRDVNVAFEHLTGKTREQLVGKRVKDVFGVVEDYWLAAYDKALKTGLPVDFENYGAELKKYYEVHIWKIRADQVAVVFTDTTERRKAEEALKESENRLKLAQQVAKVGTFEWNIQTGVNTWTPELEEMYGIPVGSFKGTYGAWEELVHPEDRAEAGSAISEALEKGSFKTEFRVTWADASIHWMLGRGWVFNDSAGKPLRMIGVNIDITESKKAEEALKESEERFSKAFNSSPAAMTITDLVEGRWVDVNESFIRLTGYSREEVVGHTSVELQMFEGDLENRTQLMQELRQRGKVQNVELAAKTKDGKVINLLFSGVVANLNGKDYIIATQVDITERKRAEEDLRLSEDKFSKAFNNSPNAITITRLSDGKIIEGNDSSYKLFGYTKDEVIGKTTVELGIWADPDDRQKLAGALRASGKAENMELNLQKKDGTKFPVNLSAALLTVSGQTCFLCSFIDLTERKRAEQTILQRNRKLEEMQQKLEDKAAETEEYAIQMAQLAEERNQRNKELQQTQLKLEERAAEVEEYASRMEELVGERTRKLELSANYARSLIEASLDPLVTISAQGRITDVNKATEEVTGCTRAELIGKNFSDYFTEPEKAAAGYKKVFTEGYLRDYPLAIRSRTGKVTEVLYNAATYSDKAGEVQGIFAVARDVTQRKALEKQLQESERFVAIGQTAGMVGHDIRNPLQAISCDMYLARSELMGLPKTKERKNILESIRETEKNVEYINKIVQDLQDYARPINPKPEECDIKETVAKMLEKQRLPRDIKVTVKVAEDASKITADSYYLTRIFYNLITNSVQAMPRGGKLIIQAKKEDNDTVISVADTGVGIPAEVRPKLFTVMFTTKSKGQGFGLPVVKRMTEALGGAVSFESQEGKGTTFTIRLPPPKKKLNGKLIYK